MMLLVVITQASKPSEFDVLKKARDEDRVVLVPTLA